MALSRIYRDARPVGLLEASTDRAVRSWWEGTAGQDDQGRVERLLCDLHSTGQWLACGCRGSAFNDLPILAPAKNDETIYLRRLTKRAEHAQECVFWSEQTTPNASDMEGGPGAVDIGAAPAFVFDEENEVTVADSRPKRNSDKQGESRAAPIPKLAKQLFWLAETAGWQHTPNAASPVESLLRTSENVTVAGDLRLRQILYCNPNVWVNAWGDSAFKRCVSAGVSPACWWVQLCTAFDQKAREVTFGAEDGPLTLKVHKDMKVFGGDASTARFPLLVVCVLRELPKHGVVLYSAYAQPVASEDHWMLVDSDLERFTLRDLLSVCKWLQDEKGILVEIDKPLHAWQGTGERPDFVLTVESRIGVTSHLVIETMGYDDPIYEARKAQLAQKVQWPVYFDRRAVQGEGSGKGLKSAVAKWAIEIHRHGARDGSPAATPLAIAMSR